MLESDDDDTGPFRFPPTATTIILDQLRKTRTTDCWFCLNADNPHLNFSPAELARVNETVGQSLQASLSGLVVREYRDAQLDQEELRRSS